MSIAEDQNKLLELARSEIDKIKALAVGIIIKEFPEEWFDGEI